MSWNHLLTARRRWVAVVLMLAVWLPGCKAEPVWPLWTQYATRFVGDQGRVIDKSGQDRTTSEGQAYAMFFALVANDRPRFDLLAKWTEDNMAAGDMTLRLPAWEWGKAPDGSWKVLDANSAGDADLWMAYSLMEGGRLWHDVRYQKMGAVMASRIAQQEVVLIPNLGPMLLPGPQGFHPDANTWLVNPSYLPPFLLEYFARNPETRGGPWASILKSAQALLAQGAGAGYAMDWVVAGNAGVHPSVTPTQLAQQTKDVTPIGSYDAIRVYLWLGISDEGTPGRAAMLASLPAMANYLKSNVTPPLQVDVTGKVLNPDGPTGFSAAVTPYLDALGLKTVEKAQMDRLEATKDPATGLYGRSLEYYDQNLALFATGWADKTFRFDRDGNLKVKWK